MHVDTVGQSITWLIDVLMDPTPILKPVSGDPGKTQEDGDALLVTCD